MTTRPTVIQCPRCRAYAESSAKYCPNPGCRRAFDGSEGATIKTTNFATTLHPSAGGGVPPTAQPGAGRDGGGLRGPSSRRLADALDVGFILYNDRIWTQAPAPLGRVQAPRLEARRCTDAAAAFAALRRDMAPGYGRRDAVFHSDGVPTAGASDPRAAGLREAAAARAEGWNIASVLHDGPTCDEQFMREVASGHHRFYGNRSGGDFIRAFVEATTTLTSGASAGSGHLLVFVCDCSGSMSEGSKLADMAEAIERALAALRAGPGSGGANPGAAAASCSDRFGGFGF